MQALSGLQIELQVVDGDIEIAQPVAALVEVTPRPACGLSDAARPRAQLGADRILVISREAADDFLDLHKHALGQLNDCGRLLRHGARPMSLELTDAHGADEPVAAAVAP